MNLAAGSNSYVYTNGPDVIGGGMWTDIITSRPWQKHVNDYSSGFWEDIPVFYEHGIRGSGGHPVPRVGVGLSMLKCNLREA
jgi:hypothetical protein